MKKNEVKSDQSYYTHGMIESLFMSLMLLLTLITEDQMDYKIEERQTITSHHADHQIHRKERNQPCMKVFGLEK